MRTPRFRPAATLSTLLLCGALASTAQADPSNKWRVEFDGRAANDGTLVLRVNPVGGESVNVETKVAASSGEEHIARAVADSLKISLGEGYHVETDDGEDVIVRSTGKTPRFDLTLARSSLTGLEIQIEPE